MTWETVRNIIFQYFAFICACLGPVGLIFFLPYGVYHNWQEWKKEERESVDK